MSKKALIIYYSQSGQLKEIADNIIRPMVKDDFYEVDFYEIKPVKDYVFPWEGKDFYNAFPESFQQIPTAIENPPHNILEKNYDLIILAYQIWFLTPSIPINSFLKSDFAKQLMNGKKTITVVGCRNMWAKAQTKVKQLVVAQGGKLVGNIAFADRHLNHISVITIVHWVMGGKKTKKWGIFPKPGVAEKDILEASKFGKLIVEAEKNNHFEGLQEKIIQHDGASLKPFIIFMDEKANKMFAIWSKFVLANPNKRKQRVRFFKAYLLIAIWLISPIVYLVFLLTYPLRIGQIKRKKTLYCGVN